MLPSGGMSVQLRGTKGEKKMIMVIGGRCQGKSSFAREHFESRIQENIWV